MNGTAVLEGTGQRTQPDVSAWERFSFEVTRSIVYGLSRVLSLTGLYHVGRAFATLEWLTNYKLRRRFARVMADLFGAEMSPREVRRASLRHFIRVRNDKLFYLIFDLLKPEEVQRRLTIRNRHLLDRALDGGRGVYLAMSHLGSQHIAVFCLHCCGYPVGGVRDPREGSLRRYIQVKLNENKTSYVRYFHNTVFPRELFRWFQGNRVLASLMDPVVIRDEHRKKTIEVTMFGRKRSLLLGPIQVATRCGAPTIQAFVISRKNFHYVIDLQGPLVDPSKVEATDERIREAMVSYAGRIERFTRTYPCHVSRI